MTILLTVYGVTILALALIVVGLVQRLMTLESNLAGPREPTQPVPDWLASRIDRQRSHHLVIVVDDTCSICHQTVAYLADIAEQRRQLLESITILANADSFETRGIPVVVDAVEHRALHPGWAPAGLIFATAGLVEAAPVGSTDAIDHALDRLDVLTELAV